MDLAPHTERKVLIVDREADDAISIERALRRAGMHFVSKRLATARELTVALDEFCPDVVVAEYELPDCSGRDALATVRRTHPEIPVVIVNGRVGEEVTVELLKAGAKEYVLKSHLQHLALSIERAIATEEAIRARKNAERALRESEEKFRTLADLAPNAFIIIDSTDRILYWNRAAERILGYSADEVIGREAHQCIAFPKFREAASAGLKTFAATGTGPVVGKTLELSARRKDGAEIPVEVSLAALHTDGQWQAFGILRDISDRRAAEVELRASEERFRLLVEEAPDAILLYDPEPNRFLSANKAAARLFQRPAEEIIQHGPEYFYKAEQPDRRPAAETVAEHVKAAVAGQEIRFERLVERPDGEARLCEGTLVRLPWQGRLILRVSFLDVTESRRMECELAAQAAILVAEHEVAPDGILVVDRESKIISFNQRFNEIWRVPPGLMAAKDDRPVLAFVAGRVADCEAFLGRVRHFYDHPEESGRDEVVLKDGRVLDRHTMPMRHPNGSYMGRVWYFRDITDKVKVQRTLERLNRALRTLSRGNEVVVRAVDETQLVNEMCRVMVEDGGYRLAWVGVPQRDVNRIVQPIAWAGVGAEAIVTETRVSWGNGPTGNGTCGRAVRSGEPQTSQNTVLDPQMAPWRGIWQRYGFASVAALPIKDEAGVFAVLMIYATEPDAFGADELRLLTELAGDLAYGIRALRDHARGELAERRWRASLEATIGVIASTVERRDPYTAGHQQRVAKLAVAIATELHLPEHEKHGLYLAGVIHDVGKITIPADILSKSGRLSKIEFQLIQEHAQSGYDIIKGVDFPWPIAEMVRQHHERLDGSGYPRGLAAEAILPEARILAVADVVEAMMSHRPYRPELGVNAALEEIEKGKGRLYDAAAVDACASLFRENRFSFSEE